MADHEQDIIERWRRAGERANEEKVRILDLDGTYRATSSSHPLGSYRLEHTPEGWACECIANGEYRMPCKHLWALADALDLDVLRDMRVEWDPENASLRAA
ncbi:MAG TPA: hypothetical protein VFB58_08500 [Chloroflexota bacterium]|nr:hypothetical protein [Chloroflexota bacterium]